MGMNIGEIGKLCAPLWNVGEIERRTEFDVKNEAGKRDSYISSVSSSELFHSTGNYDEQGQMDDDFSVNMEMKMRMHRRLCCIAGNMLNRL